MQPDVEDNVTYLPNTQNANLAAGAPEGAPVLADDAIGEVAKAAKKLNPISVVGDVLSKTADVATNQANANTANIGATTSAPIITDPQQKVLDLNQGLPAANTATQNAIGKIGEIQKDTTQGPIEHAAQANEGQLDAAAQNAAELKASIKAFTDTLQSKQTDLDAMRDELQINPQAAVQKQYFGTASHAVLSSLAMALGGIGSGLTGQPNAALQVYQSQINNAIQQRSNNIQGYLASAESKGQTAAAQMSKAQQVALANSVSTNEIYHAAEGTVSGYQALAGAKSSPQVATILKGQAQQQYTKAGVDSVQPFIGNGVLNDARQLNALGELFTGMSLGKPQSIPQQIQQRNGSIPPVQQNIPSGNKGTPLLDFQGDKSTEPKKRNFLLDLANVQGGDE